MQPTLLATTYPPPAVFLAGIASVFCEWGGGVLALLGLALCWRLSTVGASYFLAIAAVVAAGTGTVLLVVAEVYDTHHRMDADDLRSLFLGWGLPALLAVVAFCWCRRQKQRLHDHHLG